MTAVEGIVRGQLVTEYLVVGGSGVTTALPLTVALSWSPSTSHVVLCRFPTRDREVRWLIGRELLTDGCGAPAGVGDVSVLPDPFAPGFAELVLSTDRGRACMCFRVAELAAFLDRLTVAGQPPDAVRAAWLAAERWHGAQERRGPGDGP